MASKSFLFICFNVSSLKPSMLLIADKLNDGRIVYVATVRKIGEKFWPVS